MLEKIKVLRKELHRHPELSGQEVETAKRVRRFIEANHETKIIDGLGGNGLAAIYDFSGQGPTVMIRCELDALPIEEVCTFDYCSTKKGVSHKCGHDGHISIVAGLIFWIKEQNFQNGKIILLFQPAEETGKGAFDVLNDPAFAGFEPDYVFALHNIPGEPLHTIISVKNNFSASVISFAVYLTGKESHACEPENGINPALAIAELTTEFDRLNVRDMNNNKFALLTPVFINMGQQAYGISAGSGELHYTLRTWQEEEMERLKNNINLLLDHICKKHKLDFKSGWFDYFPASVNDKFCNEAIIKAAEINNFNLRDKQLPFKFGEDFGWFSQKYKSAMFGIGAGVNSPALHHEEYDFPEELIPTGINMFSTIISLLLK